jgi:hypothetical protein
MCGFEGWVISDVVNPWRAEEISFVAILPGWVLVLDLRSFWEVEAR